MRIENNILYYDYNYENIQVRLQHWHLKIRI